MDSEDLDIDGSWPLDQVSLPHNVMSPAFSGPPCSPLWAFSDAGDNGNLSSAAGDAPLRCLDFSLFPARTLNSSADKTENEDKRKPSSPFWSLMPLENPESYRVIKERMTQALRYFKDSTEQQQHVLAQVWAPVRKRDRYVLTTLGQPFVLDPNSKGLNQYRMVSLTYMFSVDGETDWELGLPGRVFKKKLPEWTPNVQYYSSREFSRLVHALNYNVQGTLALPVFEPSGQFCVGVVELIMTSQKINYAPEVDKVCKALESVNLKTSEILDHHPTRICNVDRQNALAEILEMSIVVSETHKLPLVQTWVPCMHRSILAYGGGLRKSCSSFDGSCMGQVCMSTSDIAFYVMDAHMWGFREACVEHHLQKGQGVAGRAFVSRSFCFCRDVTLFCKTEYPLVHYARLFTLTSCFAICLQSNHTGDEYVLEFFLPPTVTDKSKQDALLGSLLATMKKLFRNLKVASGAELGEDETSVEIVEASADGMLYLRLEPIRVHQSKKAQQRINVPQREDELKLNPTDKQLMLTPDMIDNNGNNAGNLGRCNSSALFPKIKDRKKSDRKRGKTEKAISLEVLQQHFAGSLKDAAKSLGVCPTTMKRICRQHGISRWPSRKINKVNHSLTKLKHAIDSVQGGDGAINFSSFTSNPLPVPPCLISPPSNPHTMNQQDMLSSKRSENQAQNSIQLNHRSLGSYSQAVRNEQEAKNVSREASDGPPTSHGSYEVSPLVQNTSPSDRICGSVQEQCIAIAGASHELAFQPIREPFEGMLLEDSGSSKDLVRLSPSAADPVKQEMKSISIKATYGKDIIRFRLSPSSGIMDLREEVSKRLKFEVNAFDIKYLDDDHEWVLISCEADLQECLDLSRSSGCNTIRLSVHDLMPNFGSSCESTAEL